MVIFGSVVAGGFGDPVFAGPVVDDLGLATAPAKVTRSAGPLGQSLSLAIIDRGPRLLELSYRQSLLPAGGLGVLFSGCVGAGWDPTLLPASSLKTKAVAWYGPGHGFGCG